MSFLCSKNLTLGGIEYRPGEIIPDGIVLESRVRTLKTAGYIKEMDEAELHEGVAEELLFPSGPEGTVWIPIITDVPGEDDIAQVESLPMTESEIQLAASILQMKAEEAAKRIETVDSDNVLIFLNACDSRSTVKSAAKKQAGKLSTTEGDKNEARTGNESVDGN